MMPISSSDWHSSPEPRSSRATSTRTGRPSLWSALNSIFWSAFAVISLWLDTQPEYQRFAGLTFGEAKELIAKEFSRYYTDFNLNVSMGRLRSIQIFVVGHARSPGRYTVSSLSTLINALFAAGGPSKSGTMRDIRVIRSGETVGRFDMYDFLLRGDKSGDVRVMPEDVVFIPPVGALVALAGNVKTPATC